MKRVIAVLFLLVALAVTGWLAHQAVERDREYMRLVRQGDEALGHGQAYAAIEAFTGAIALKPESMLGYLRRGEAQQRKGDSTETATAALRDFRTAAALDPTAPRVQEKLGDVNVQLRRYANAAESYEAYLRLDDHSPTVFYKLALAVRGMGNLSRAISALRNAVALNPSFAEAHYVLGLCLKDRDEFPEAEQALLRAVELAPAMIPAREALAEVHRLQGEIQEEIEQLEALAALDRTRAERQIAVGLAYSRAGDPDLAVTALGRAVERFHDNPAVYAALGEVWLDTSEERNDKAALRKSLEALGPVANQPSAGSRILTLYGRALALNGELDLAEATFRRATQQFPLDSSSLTNLAAVERRLGKFVEARQELLKYMTLVDDDPEEAAHAAQIAELSMTVGEPAVAASWYEKSAAVESPDAALLAHLADAYLRSGRPDAAKTAIVQALEKNAGDSSVRAIALRIQHVTQPVTEKVEPQNQ